ncbi:FAD-linked oxidoreductase [Streptomyces sp. WAC 01529]|uniref:FAD-binding oxidoreductase n=1 Tax=Streptomyces sp. WAC 01529 TaxID=2203205 RepID=UPI000F6EAA7D|nr:FAD-binding oxidoreductase [Streptomyces sp. WAC 01529]AZM53253.1 FAD-linked oxidoreductase [Streptomyces sp. WAC 01529]
MDFTAQQFVFRPGDPGYEDGLAGFQTGFVTRPDLVVGATSAEDVVAAVSYAAGQGLPVGVQATGHGLPGASEGGVLISTRHMDSVRVDADARTVTVGAGARWGQVVEAAAPHGLAPLNGSAPGVGVVSYTLGGGLGILAREFGYAADHVRSLDVVTADGTLRHVTAESAPELFWGLLGGGANLGVVTELEIGLVPVARLYGGAITFDGRTTEPAALLRGYEEWTRTLPDELTSSLAAVVYPDLPQLPPPLRGRYLVSVRVAFTGAAAEGERLVAPLRALGPAVSDTLREMPYTESPTIHSDPDFPHAYYGDSALLSGLDVTTAGELLALTGPDADAMHVVQLNHLGGALGRPAPNAVPYREAGWLVRILSPLDGTSVAVAREVHARAFGCVAGQRLGRSLNFAFGGGDRPEGLYDADTRKRLAELKATYDPANLFRRNYSVRQVL